MSWRSVLTVNHDALGSIERDPEFGEAVSDAIKRHFLTREPTHVQIRGCSGYSFVIGHGDIATPLLIAVDGNLGHLVGYTDTKKQVDECLLRDLAERLGYKLVKKGK